MSNSRAALRERFRATLAGRAHKIAELLPAACRTSRDGAERTETLGELHTLKGEARMLGWSNLSTLAHGLEEGLREDQPDAEALSAVVDSVLLSLSPETTEEVAEELWSTALAALGLQPAAAEDEQEAGGNEEKEADEVLVEGPSDDPESSEVGPPEKSRWVQVDARTIDELGERLASLSSDLSQFVSGLKGSLASASALEQRETEAQGERLKSTLAGALLLSLDLRLTPLEPVLGRLAAHARVLAGERGKSVAVNVRSGGVRIERNIIERLNEPLLHLVSNAVDHGIERPEERGSKPSTARIDLSAEPEGTMVRLRIEDDGRGVDLEQIAHRAAQRSPGLSLEQSQEALSVLFQPGFSTRETIDEVSGRGMGLDVVKRQVEALGGTVSVESDLGIKTSFLLLVPAALAQERLLVVRAGETLYGIADRLVVSVEEQQKGNEGETSQVTFRYRNETLPLRAFSSLLSSKPGGPESSVLILRLAGKRYAVACEQVLGHFDLIRRPTGPGLASRSGVCASAQTDEGEMVLVLDPRLLSRELTRETGEYSRAVMEEPGRSSKASERARILVVDDSVVVRDLLAEVLSSAGYQVRGVKNGKEALAELPGFEPDLVLSDIEMPEMDGFRLLETIRKRNETLPVVLVTARSSEEDRRRAESLGASAYVTKGEFRSESLVETVGRLMRGSS